MNKSEQLIACLEGEIAKRDEELAACRVAVENCEVFRARIAEMQERFDSSAHRTSLIGRLEIENAQLSAELAAIKAQEPVAYISGCYRDVIDGKSDRTPLGAELAFVNMGWIGQIPLYAAPVSEAKAQGVVMPERANASHGSHDHQSGWNACLDEVARLNAAPVQQVSVPDEMRSLAQRLREYNQNPHHINPMSEAFHILVADAANALSTACVPKEIAVAITWSEHLLFECGALTSTRAPSVHVYNKTFAAVNEARAMLASAPAAPAADAWLVEALENVLKSGRGSSGRIILDEEDEADARAALAAHRANGVV